jgi:hypothetical protein
VPPVAQDRVEPGAHTPWPSHADHDHTPPMHDASLVPQYPHARVDGPVQVGWGVLSGGGGGFGSLGVS